MCLGKNNQQSKIIDMREIWMFELIPDSDLLDPDPAENGPDPG